MSAIEKKVGKLLLSRRELLASGSAAAAKAAGYSNDEPPQDPVISLMQKREQIRARAIGLCRRWQKMEAHLIKTIGFPQVIVPSADITTGICAQSHAEIDRALGEGEQLFDQRDQLHAQLAQHRARWSAEAERIGFDETDGQLSDAWDEEVEATTKIFGVQATTLAGIAGKIAVMMELCRTGSDDPDFPLAQLQSALADVTRLQVVLDSSVVLTHHYTAG